MGGQAQAGKGCRAWSSCRIWWIQDTPPDWGHMEEEPSGSHILGQDQVVQGRGGLSSGRSTVEQMSPPARGMTEQVTLGVTARDRAKWSRVRWHAPAVMHRVPEAPVEPGIYRGGGVGSAQLGAGSSAMSFDNLERIRFIRNLLY